MKLIIDIPTETYDYWKEHKYEYVLSEAIANGTPYNPTGDLISRKALINAKPEFMNEKIVRGTKYRTTKDRVYAKAWNACNSYWLNTIDNVPTVLACRKLEQMSLVKKTESEGYRMSGEDKSVCRTCKYQYANDTFKTEPCICVHHQSEFFGIHLFPNSPMGCPQYCATEVQGGLER